MSCAVCGGSVPAGRAVCDACKERLAPAPSRGQRPAGADPLRELARLLRAGKLDDAEVICQRVLAANPAESSALVALGDIAAARGQMQEAAAAYQQALHALPGRRDEVLLKLQRAREAAGRTGGPALELEMPDDDGTDDLNYPQTPLPPATRPDPEDEGMEFIGETASPAPPPPDEPEIDYGSPLAEWLTPRQMWLLIIAATVIATTVLLMNWRPWHAVPRPPVHVTPLRLDTEEQEPILTPADAPDVVDEASPSE